MAFRYFETSTVCERIQAYLKATGEDHTLADVIRWASNMFAQPASDSIAIEGNDVQGNKAQLDWRIVRVEPIEDIALFRYLKSRGISPKLGSHYLKEVYLRHNSTLDAMYTLGIPNEDGGYGVINPFLEANIGPQAISFVRGHKPKANKVHIFHDFMDMLSAFIRFPQLRDSGDSICLNSHHQINDAFAYIKDFGYTKLYDWTSNTLEGKQVSKRLRAASIAEPQLRHFLMHKIYARYRTLNDWHVATLGP
ncbi:hypothetical protein [Mucilaginibacter sp. MD40]|uniref:hypothetical protein n=1 Tax=Mucilaginibacter sp. MD40 TaxID=2029590 RepID=UPI00117DA5D9|nr:hypothetical protein [Mucilaginibacter sp. MD40]